MAKIAKCVLLLVAVAVVAVVAGCDATGGARDADGSYVVVGPDASRGGSVTGGKY